MDININVSGTAGSGKTTVSAIIANTLRDLGFTVEIEEDVDFASEADLLAMSTEQRVEAVAGSKTIKLVQTQLSQRARPDGNKADIEYFEGKLARADESVVAAIEHRNVCVELTRDADDQIESATRRRREAEGRLELIQEADRTYGLEGI